MAPERHPIPFEEFGPLFIEQIITPERVRSQFVEIIGEEPIRFEDNLAEGTATPVLGHISRIIEPCQVAFNLPITLQMAFTLTLLGESYEGPASLNLQLVARTYAPAVLYFRGRPVRGEDIVFDADVIGGWGLAKGFGPQWRIVDHLVRSRIKNHVNARMAQTRGARVIDLASLALETMTVKSPTAHPAPAERGEDQVPVVRSGVSMKGALAPASQHLFALVLGEGEERRLQIYTTSREYPFQMQSGLEVLDPGGNTLRDTRLSTGGAWFGEYEMREEVVRAPRLGVYRLRLQSLERKADHIIDYQIRQRTSRRVMGKKICFEAFGAALMKQVVSPPIVEERIRQVVPEVREFGPLNVLPLTTARGTARISIVSIRPDRPRRKMADREVALKMQIAVDPDVCIAALGMQEQWLVRTLINVQLQIHALADPLAIQVGLGEMTGDDVEVVEATCTEGAGAFNQMNLLARAIAQPLIQEIQQILAETEFERIVDIERFASEAMELRAPGLPEPQTIIAQLKTRTTVRDTTRVGQAPRYWAIGLERKQKIQLKARWRLSSHPGRPLVVSLAVCDEHLGVVRVENFASGAGKRGSGDLSYTAPEAGHYSFRLRFDPWPGDDGIAVDYELRVMVT